MRDEQFTQMPETLRPKVQACAQQMTARLTRICSRHNIPEAAAAAFIADATDMLAARFDGLRATTEQMRAIVDGIKPHFLARSENVAPDLIRQYYEEILQTIDGRSQIFPDYLNAAVVYEVAKRTAPDFVLICDTKERLADARRLYYTYCVLTVGLLCDATEDELRQIKPQDGATVLPEQAKDRLIKQAIQYQKQRAAMLEQQSQRRQQRRQTKAQAEADLFTADTKATKVQTLVAFHSIITEQVETKTKRDDDAAARWQPIWETVAQQRKMAEQVMNDQDADDATKERVRSMACTEKDFRTAIDLALFLPQWERPAEKHENTTLFKVSPRRAYMIATGIQNPNSEQIDGFLKALRLLDTQRLMAVQKVQKKNRYKDENGKTKTETRIVDKCTDFRPVNVTFEGVGEKQTLLLDIHNIMIYGRTGKTIDIDGKSCIILPAAKRFLSAPQYYSFTAEAERIFRNIVITSTHKNEADMLRVIFGYEGRQAQLNEQAQAAQARYDELKRSRPADDEELLAAEASAKRATEQAKYQITNHIGRDFEALAAMFEKAEKSGLIVSYNRRRAVRTASAKKYGSGYIWEWKRPTADDEQK